MKKQNKGSLLILELLFCLILTPACQNYREQVASLQMQCDSLETVIAQRDSSAEVMNDYLEVIASSLDSIKTAESIYTLTVDESGRALKRKDIKENLNLLESVVQRQRERIEELEGRLRQSSDSVSYYKTLIENLYAQIDQKDREIAMMRASLAQKDRRIRTLSTQVENMQQSLDSAQVRSAEQEQTIALQTDILKTQDMLANTGYILTARKRELQDMGIVGRGFNAKKLNPHNINPDKFTLVDMRDFTEMSLASKRAVILSSMPADSYTLTYTGTETILTITDPGRFWSLTAFLIVQL